jgi:hypothetical protein
VAEAPGLLRTGGGGGSRLFFKVPKALAVAAFGEGWQQPGFKVQLYLYEDGDCIAGGCRCGSLT